MVVLADNDILFKLAACRLIDRLPDLLGVDQSQIWVREAAVHVARSSRDRYSTESIERVVTFLSGTSVLDADLVDDNVLERLLQLERMDTGEAILFALAANLEDSCIATGDKRSLRCLSESPDCEDLCARLSESIICFEQIMHWLMQKMDYAKYRSHVAPARTCDGVLEYMAFSQGLDTPHDHARDAFQSNIRSLREETN
ncbi:MAG: hypothetical protein GVY12_16775, partial [Bacteroidetes bacterium]|nr:hypothetical protein [Bacteroidota bacterium]